VRKASAADAARSGSLATSAPANARVRFIPCSKRTGSASSFDAAAAKTRPASAKITNRSVERRCGENRDAMVLMEFLQ